jgi:hypothetical protein
MRNPWPVAIVKRVSAAKHELIIFLHDGQVSQPVSPQNEGRPDPPSASPVDELQRLPDGQIRKLFDYDERITERHGVVPKRKGALGRRKAPSRWRRR